MNSAWKAILHSVVSVLPTLVAFVIASHSPVLDLSIGQIIGLIANYFVSHNIPTTSGRSATQGVVEFKQ